MRRYSEEYNKHNYVEYKEKKIQYASLVCIFNRTYVPTIISFCVLNQSLHKNNYLHLIKFILTSKIINLINEGFYVSRYNE